MLEGIGERHSNYNQILYNELYYGDVGIYLDNSNYNTIKYNTFFKNRVFIQEENNCIGNIIEDNYYVKRAYFNWSIIIIAVIVLIIISVCIFLYYKLKKKKASMKSETEDEIAESVTIQSETLISEEEQTPKIFPHEIEQKESQTSMVESISVEDDVPPLIEQLPEISPVDKFNIFLSYSTLDSQYFQIEKIVELLEQYPEIGKIYYWEADSKENIVEFMNETLKKINVFILLCSENSLKSKAVNDEWQAAFQMRKEGLLKIIPVYEQQDHIPNILWHLLNVKYTKDDFKGFLENLHREILR